MKKSSLDIMPLIHWQQEQPQRRSINISVKPNKELRIFIYDQVFRIGVFVNPQTLHIPDLESLKRAEDLRVFEKLKEKLKM